MNVLLMLGTVLGVLGLLLAAIVLVCFRAPVRAALAAGVAAAWAGGYGTLLVAASLLSRETVLPPGETKSFCGFFLDCHIGVAVLADTAVPAIGSRRAAAALHVVTLRFSSSARRATLSPYDVQVELIGDDGRSYHGAASAGHALEHRIEPGGSYAVDVVFDLPARVTPTRLLVSQGVGIDRILDGLVIGNENSFLHRRTYLALPS